MTQSKTLIEISREKQVPYRTLYQWLWEGRIKGEKVGGKWLIEESEVEKINQKRLARLGKEK